MNAPAQEDDTLRLACSCGAEECDTWLELTGDGFLILEDKDGCRVSLLLSEALAAALRRALREELQTNRAVSESEANESQPPDAATLWQWVDQSGLCTATDGCWCDPAGTCEHGYPSWLIVLGLV